MKYGQKRQSWHTGHHPLFFSFSLLGGREKKEATHRSRQGMMMMGYHPTREIGARGTRKGIPAVFFFLASDDQTIAEAKWGRRGGESYIRGNQSCKLRRTAIRGRNGCIQGAMMQSASRGAVVPPPSPQEGIWRTRSGLVSFAVQSAGASGLGFTRIGLLHCV